MLRKKNDGHIGAGNFYPMQRPELVFCHTKFKGSNAISTSHLWSSMPPLHSMCTFDFSTISTKKEETSKPTKKTSQPAREDNQLEANQDCRQNDEKFM